MSRSPLVVLGVVGALGAVFALCTMLLIRREEHSGAEPETQRQTSAGPIHEPSEIRTRPSKAPRVRTPKPPRRRTPEDGGRASPPTRRTWPSRSEPRAATASEPDPRRPSLVDNLDAFTRIRSG